MSELAFESPFAAQAGKAARCRSRHDKPGRADLPFSRVSDPWIHLSPSKWVFPAADGTQRPPVTNLKAVLQRALGRAGIVDGYEHRCRKPGCGHVELGSDDGNRRCPKDNRALWIRPLPRKGIVFHSLRQTTATLLVRAKVHPSVAQKIVRHADIETTLAIYTHLDGIEDMRAAVVKGSQGSTRIRRDFATNLLPPIERLLTVRQVAELLGVCRATVYKWAADGVLPHVRIVNVIRIRRTDLGAFLASHRPPPG